MDPLEICLITLSHMEETRESRALDAVEGTQFPTHSAVVVTPVTGTVRQPKALVRVCCIDPSATWSSGQCGTQDPVCVPGTQAFLVRHLSYEEATNCPKA